MGNEAGEWIIHGVKWNDPKCIQDVDEAVEYINRVGFLPLFKNEIPGFSLEERTVAEYWWSDDPVRDPWRWRIAIAKKHDIPVIAFAGSVTKEAVACNQNGIDAFFPILRGVVTLEEAMKPENAKANMTDTVEQVFRLMNMGRK